MSKKLKTEIVISPSIYIHVENPKVCWVEGYNSKHDAKIEVHAILKYLELDIINHPNLQRLSLSFGTSRGIFGPPNQHLSPIAPDHMLLCVILKSKKFPHKINFCLLY